MSRQARAVARTYATAAFLRFSSEFEKTSIEMNSRGPTLDVWCFACAVDSIASKCVHKKGVDGAKGAAVITRIFGAPMSSPSIMLVDLAHELYGLPPHGVKGRIENGMFAFEYVASGKEEGVYRLEVLKPTTEAFDSLPQWAQTFANEVIEETKADLASRSLNRKVA